MARFKTKRWLILMGVIAIGLVSLLLTSGAISRTTGGAKDEPAAQSEVKTAPRAAIKPVVVTVEPVTARPLQRKVNIVGSFWGQDEVAITPKVEGRIKKIYHDVGDVVKPGELLLEIEDIDYQLAVTEAQRALDLELAKLGLQQLPARDFDVQVMPSVIRAASLVKNAAAKRDRLARVGGGASSGEERDQAATDHAVAVANLQQTIIEVQTTLASVRHRQAILDTAQQRLKETRVYAPDFHGPRRTVTGAVSPDAIMPMQEIEYVVAQRLAATGELLRISPTTTMTAFRLVIDNPLKLQAIVPESHLGEIALGQSVDIDVEAYRKEVFKGRVSRVNRTVDRANRTFQVEVEVPNPDRRLSAGCFAKAAIHTRVDDQALTVPEEALVAFAGVNKVFVIRDGKSNDVKVSLTGIRIPLPDQNGRTQFWAEVRGELKVGDLVVTSGQSQLAEGTRVVLRSDSSAKE